LRTIVIAFEYVTGRHTAINIKKQYDSILERYNIENKVLKVVADQAANMKKALSDERESNCIVGGASEDNLINLTKLLVERRRKLDKIHENKQNVLVDEINKSINEINSEFANSKSLPKFNRLKIISELDELTEELTDESDEEENNHDDTGLDVSNEEESDILDPSMLRFVFDSYLPCAAHNSQLVLKDGLKLNEEYTQLIKKVSKDIVSKIISNYLKLKEIC